jgi:hypothetical protein
MRVLFMDLVGDHLICARTARAYMKSGGRTSHAAILCGLLKIQVYSDMEVAFAISEDAAVYKALSQTIELEDVRNRTLTLKGG